MSKKYKILISGGGTGGHIFPAIAIANGLKNKTPDSNILFVGAKGKMEMEKVPLAGYPIHGLWISGIQRRLTLKNIMFPFKLASSLYKARKIINDFFPDVVIGTGGYASGPLLRMAASKKIPTLILEQNSYPGITNKWLGSKVNIICTAYPDMDKYFPKDKIVVTGSPIRKEIKHSHEINPEKAKKFFKLDKNKFTLLIIGGSQGAKKMNEGIAAKIEQMLTLGIQIIWQTGKPSFEMAQKSILNSKFRQYVKIVDFIHEMDQAYAAADLLISRAGAIAIAEIIEVAKPAVFVPLPSAAENHQEYNARSLVKENAAEMIIEKHLEKEIIPVITKLIKEDKVRNEIIKNLKSMQHGDATEKIINEVIRLVEKK